jgi:hypothetical protein
LPTLLQNFDWGLALQLSLEGEVTLTVNSLPSTLKCL